MDVQRVRYDGLQRMRDVAGNTFRQRTYYQRVEKADDSRAEKIYEQSRPELLGVPFEGHSENTRHPEPKHGACKLKRHIDFINRMRITQIARFFSPRLDEEPEEANVHQDAGEP